MKKSDLKRIIKTAIREAIILKKHGNDILAVSDLGDEKERSRETFKHKNALKSHGFRWDGSIGSWKINASQFDQANTGAKAANPAYKIIDAVENLPEMISSEIQVPKGEGLSKKIESYISNLIEDIDNLKNSEEFMNFLAFNAKFHNYSLNNTLLIYIQKRNASRVAGYNKWKSLHRTIKAGDNTPIWIYAPMTAKVREKDLDDEIKDKRVTFFRLVKVYDVSDTIPLDERGELPKAMDWKGDSSPNEVAAKLSRYALDLADTMGIEITNDPTRRGEGGYSAGGRINISSGSDGIFKARTLIHEIAHELLHQKENSLFAIEEPDTAVRELQADSVAYIILKHYDLPVTSTVNYLAGWKANKDKIMKNLSILKKTADFIITELDKIGNRENRKSNG